MLKRYAVSGFLAITLAALAAGPGNAQQSQTGRLQGLSLSSGLPIQIESDRLEVQEAEHKATFMGNVNVSQGPTTMKAGKMTVYYAVDDKSGSDTGSAATGSSGAIDHLEVEDKVYIKSDSQVATGDRGTFDMNTQILTLSGKEVVLTEGKNTLVGCKLTVDMRSGKATVDGCGRVIMQITPNKQKP